MELADKNEGFRFEIGQIVHHKRYDYRGAIVARDLECQADDAWYYGNQTQPPRDQPWYHVLVDGRSHTTYVAESHLEPDATGAQIRHPLLDRFFQSYTVGRYLKGSPPN